MILYLKQEKMGYFIYVFYFFFLLYIQYFNLQIIQHERYTKKSKNNSLRKLIIPAPRGIIYDRNRLPLVDNMPIYEVKIRPEDVNEDFNYDVFSKIKNDVLIVNTSRGEIVNETDLVNFLGKNHNARYATDVLTNEIRDRESSPLFKYAKNNALRAPL